MSSFQLTPEVLDPTYHRGAPPFVKASLRRAGASAAATPLRWPAAKLALKPQGHKTTGPRRMEIDLLGTSARFVVASPRA